MYAQPQDFCRPTLTGGPQWTVHKLLLVVGPLFRELYESMDEAPCVALVEGSSSWAWSSASSKKQESGGSFDC